MLGYAQEAAFARSRAAFAEAVIVSPSELGELQDRRQIRGNGHAQPHRRCHIALFRTPEFRDAKRPATVPNGGSTRAGADRLIVAEGPGS